MSQFVRSVMPAIAGFVVYGGWALYVNLEFEPGSGIKAGLIQGSYSLLLTLSTTILMEYLWRRLDLVKYRIAVTIAITSSITFSVAYGIHWLFNTPEIVLTILPGFLIGVVYAVAYVLSLNKLSPLKSE